jgi:hypothetical protein
VQIEPSGLRPYDQVPLFGSRLVYNGRAQSVVKRRRPGRPVDCCDSGPISSNICGGYRAETQGQESRALEARLELGG